MLDFARLGASDFADGGDRKLSGMYNAVSNGRSVTFVLQKLKGRAAGFEPWYAGIQEKLRADPVSKWFVELRNRIEKEGTHGDAFETVYFKNFRPGAVARQGPPNTIETIIGAPDERSWWNVRLADGSVTQVYFQLPASVSWLRLTIADAPGQAHLEDLLPQWLDGLEAILEEAEQKFGGASR